MSNRKSSTLSVRQIRGEPAEDYPPGRTKKKIKAYPGSVRKLANLDLEVRGAIEEEPAIDSESVNKVRGSLPNIYSRRESIKNKSGRSFAPK